MRETYENMTVLELRKVAKDKGVKLGAGISKQGIIDKLLDTETTETPVRAQVSFAASAPAAPAGRYNASIITDEESDDVPVLTPNPAVNLTPRKTAVRPASPAPQGTASSLSSISSKAPAFTMEGSRAWHNPSAYQTQPAYQSRPQNRPSYAGNDRYGSELRPQPDSRYNSRPTQRPDPRYQRPQASYQQPAFQAPGRFGPDLTSQEPQQQNEFQPAEQQHISSSYRSEYSARPQQEFVPPTAPEYNRRDPYAPANRESTAANASAMQDMMMVGECGDGAGVLDIHPEGYGFLRADHFLPGKNDVYVSNAQIRRFSLRSGDYVAGKTRPQQPGSRYSALLYITEINGQQPDETLTRPAFDQFTALYPKKRIAFGKENDLFLRAVDTLSPIGFGQRALIQVPPRGGRTTLIKKMAAAVHKHHPAVHIMTLLIDERPEDVVDMKESVPGNVLYSAFDSSPENHLRVSELTVERAQRLVEQKQDVVLFIDSMTRLCRACNALAPQNSRTLQSGLALGGLSKAKKIFGAARNTREGGSLTIIALFETDTQSPLDEAILQEFRGTANMELQLERIPGEKRMVPCINAHRAATRHDELLLTLEEISLASSIREKITEIPSRTAQALIPLLEE